MGRYQTLLSCNSEGTRSDITNVCASIRELITEILWPGNQDYALRYREKLYYFSSEEAKEKFAEDPGAYIAQGKPLKVFMRNVMIKRVH